MTEIQVGGSPEVALTHLTMFGLAAILEDAGEPDVRVHWTDGMNPRPKVTIESDETVGRIGRVVQAHATAHATPTSWVAATRSDDQGRQFGLMSPRVSAPTSTAGWEAFLRQRADVIDALVVDDAALDLRFIGALGAPSPWHRTGVPGQRLREPRPDWGASRWEMTPRNRGTEFVQNRLVPLAADVAKREPASIIDGLVGAAFLEGGRQSGPDGRRATGLAEPGPTDDAMAWCALWGISLFPLVPLVQRASRAAGHLPQGRHDRGYFYVPMPVRPLCLAAMRTIMVSSQLAAVASPEEGTSGGPSPISRSAAQQWLAVRGIGAVARFPIHASANKNAPEYRAKGATLLPTGVRDHGLF